MIILYEVESMTSLHSFPTLELLPVSLFKHKLVTNLKFLS
jgi:hypothetical protein